MKTLLTFLLSLFLLASCWNSDNYGYPSKVEFGKEGGLKDCPGTSSFYDVDIHDYNGNGEATISKGENDTIIVTYDWVSVKYKLYRAGLKITALPNTTGKNRRLYVYLYVDDSFAEIKVTQRR